MTAAADRAARRLGLSRRLRLGQLLALIIGGPLAILLISVAVGLDTVVSQGSIRDDLLNRVEPANGADLRLATAMVNQETGIRGYELTGKPVFLQPYYLGRSQQRTEVSHLRQEAIPGTASDLTAVLERIQTWEGHTAAPAVVAAALHRGTTAAIHVSLAGKRRFDAIRSALMVLQTKITARVRAVKRELANSAHTTTITLAVIAVVLLLTFLGAARALRRLISEPLRQLTDTSRRVADGELSQSLLLAGPLDIETLGRDVDGMRLRLLQELDAANSARNALTETAAELERSNVELEQFAYVASHDLQEPLRKVTSFCQLLQERYGGQLDEKADQYIEFAVDGAMRMQQLVNDLLAFSRVGRSGTHPELQDLNVLANVAVSDLQSAIDEADAQITIEELPSLAVDASLMRTVFQNLLANAIKFRAEARPSVHIGARRVDDHWLFSVTDNGIGIEPDYAARIFVIFQRLHTREHYDGTGIGLSMCRKIIESHGGAIWLDTEYRPGTRISFTLPARSATMVG